MTAWSWSIGPWRAGASAVAWLRTQGGPQRDLGTATARSLTIKLLEPSTAAVTVLGDSDEALILEELITDVWVYRDHVPLFRGRMASESTDDNLDEQGVHRVTAKFVDYRGVLDRRLRYSDRTWTNVEQATIVWDAISDAQAALGGDLGLTQAPGWAATGVVRPSVIVKTGDYVGPFIATLARMSNGFDWDIDTDLQVWLYYPKRGKDVGAGATLDWGGVVAQARRSFDPSKYAQAIRQSGADGVAASTASAPDLATAPEGRWDAQFSDTNLTTADMVAQTALSNLASASLPVPTYTLTLAAGAWGGPAHLWVGDYVQVVIKSGRLNEQSWARVFELAISVDASDQESVTVTVGDVRMDPRSIIRGIMKRIDVLAKR